VPQPVSVRERPYTLRPVGGKAARISERPDSEQRAAGLAPGETQGGQGAVGLGERLCTGDLGRREIKGAVGLGYRFTVYADPATRPK
jgi:hypothetical protein